MHSEQSDADCKEGSLDRDGVIGKVVLIRIKEKLSAAIGRADAEADDGDDAATADAVARGIEHGSDLANVIGCFDASVSAKDRYLSLRGILGELDEFGALLVGDLAWSEFLFEFGSFRLGDLEFGFRGLDAFLCGGLVGALHYEHLVGDKVAAESNEDADSREGQADPAEYAGPALEFVGSHWDEWFAFAALLYAAYAFGFSGAVLRMTRATANDLKLSDRRGWRDRCAAGSAGSSGGDSRAGSLQRMVRRCG